MENIKRKLSEEELSEEELSELPLKVKKIPLQLPVKKAGLQWLKLLRETQLEAKASLIRTRTIESQRKGKEENIFSTASEPLPSGALSVKNPEKYIVAANPIGKEHISFEFVMSPLSFSENAVIEEAKNYSDADGNYLHNILNTDITIIPRTDKEIVPLLQVMAQQAFYKGLSSEYSINRIQAKSRYPSKYLAYATLYDHIEKLYMVIGQVTASASEFNHMSLVRDVDDNITDIDKIGSIIKCFGIDIIAKAVFPGTISNPLGGIVALLLFNLMLLGYIRIKRQPVMMILESVMTGFTQIYGTILRQGTPDYMELKAQFVTEVIYGPRQSYTPGTPGNIISLDDLKLGAKAKYKPIVPMAPDINIEDESNYEILGPLISCPYNTYLNIPLRNGLRLNYVKIISKLCNISQFSEDEIYAFIELQDSITMRLDIIDDTSSTPEEIYDSLYYIHLYVEFLFDLLFTVDINHPLTQSVIFNTKFDGLIDLGIMVDETSVIHAINTYGGIMAKKTETARLAKEARMTSELQPLRDELDVIKELLSKIQVVQAFQLKHTHVPVPVSVSVPVSNAEGFKELEEKENNEERVKNMEIAGYTEEDDHILLSLPVRDGIFINDKGEMVKGEMVLSSTIEVGKVPTIEGAIIDERKIDDEDAGGKMDDADDEDMVTGGRTTRHKKHRKTMRQTNKKNKRQTNKKNKRRSNKKNKRRSNKKRKSKRR